MCYKKIKHQCQHLQSQCILTGTDLKNPAPVEPWIEWAWGMLLREMIKVSVEVQREVRSKDSYKPTERQRGQREKSAAFLLWRFCHTAFEWAVCRRPIVPCWCVLLPLPVSASLLQRAERSPSVLLIPPITHWTDHVHGHSGHQGHLCYSSSRIKAESR